MSVFKTEWIVLQVGKYSEQELFYKILFRDYGILTVKKKKKVREKPIDVWYFISCEILTNSERKIHTIWNIKVKCFFIAEWKPYKHISAFLHLIQYIKQELIEGSPHYEIYDILSQYIENCERNELILTHLKVIQCLWSLQDTHNNIDIQKVLKFIHTHNYKDIMRLKNIPDELRWDLEKILY